MRNNGKGGMRTSGNNYSIWCPKCGKPAARMDITPNGNTYMHFTKKGVVYHSAPQKESEGKHMNKQNTIPEIKEGDLIKLDYNDADHCDYYQFFDVRKLTVESCERLKTEGAYGEDPGRLYLLAWYQNRDSFVHFVDDEKDSVTAIYRKINKDYICIWEKEGNT